MKIRIRKSLLPIVVLLAAQWAQAQSKIEIKMNELKEGLYAKMETSKGDMLIELYPEIAPLTVANFVGLAEGKIKNSAKAEGMPYYDGLIFHRVISNFMIQGGDPNGDGRGGPGYKFADEFSPKLRHDKKGILSMANAGPGTNGSQFFITQVPTPHLNDKHTIFGSVIEGIDVIDAIVEVEKNSSDKPFEDILIEKLTIVRKGKKMSDYEGGALFTSIQKEKIEKAEKELTEKMKKYGDSYEVSSSGLRYKITKENKGGQLIENGSKVSLHYTGKLADNMEKAFDSSIGRSPLDVNVGERRLIPGFEEGLLYMREGEVAHFLIPPDLGYGAAGAPGVIPPNAVLFFEIEALKVE